MCLCRSPVAADKARRTVTWLRGARRSSVAVAVRAAMVQHPGPELWVRALASAAATQAAPRFPFLIFPALLAASPRLSASIITAHAVTARERERQREARRGWRMGEEIEGERQGGKRAASERAFCRLTSAREGSRIKRRLRHSAHGVRKVKERRGERREKRQGKRTRR